jgi:hypothetical protein
MARFVYGDLPPQITRAKSIESYELYRFLKLENGLMSSQDQQDSNRVGAAEPYIVKRFETLFSDIYASSTSQ